MNKLPEDIINLSAVISDDGKYRYWLKRDMSKYELEARPCVFIMLNPSTADHKNDDPTIRRCRGFAEQLNYNMLIVVNLFALRATDPKDLYSNDDPIGILNDQAIQKAVEIGKSNKGMVICAWGNHGKYMDRGNIVLNNVGKENLHYLKLNKGNIPAHPLYLRKNLKPLLMNQAKTDQSQCKQYY